MLHSYVPKNSTVPGNDPPRAGIQPPYSPLTSPSCLNIVQYDCVRELYLGGKCGSPCCRVLTVSNECISMSPVEPPIPPAIIACAEHNRVSIRVGRKVAHRQRECRVTTYMEERRPTLGLDILGGTHNLADRKLSVSAFRQLVWAWSGIAGDSDG